jgi:hypothetical protein
VVSANETDTSAANIVKVVAASRKSNIEGLLSDWCDNAAQTAWFGNEWQFFRLLRRAHYGLAEEEKMKTKAIIAAAVLTAVAAPAFADSYYVVQDAKTKKCTITETKPTTTETTVVGDGTVYKTRSEAETGMKTVKVCTSN